MTVKLSYNRTFEGRRKQLGAIEAVITAYWVDAHSQDYERFGYNVPLWMDPPPADIDINKIASGSEYQPLHRIDVIAGKRGVIDIIEVKEYGNTTAIGQLLVYENLYWMSYSGFTAVQKILVALEVSDAIKAVCGGLGITVWEADEDLKQAISEFRSQSKEARRGSGTEVGDDGVPEADQVSQADVNWKASGFPEVREEPLEDQVTDGVDNVDLVAAEGVDGGQTGHVEGDLAVEGGAHINPPSLDDDTRNTSVEQSPDRQ